MNGRTPTEYEKRYIRACIYGVGCIACRLDDDPQLDPNPSYMVFHHDPDYGSVKPDCHLHGFGLCIQHHQGIDAPTDCPVRHQNESRFIASYDRDEALCKATWAFIKPLMRVGRIPQSDLMDYCPFEEMRDVT